MEKSLCLLPESAVVEESQATWCQNAEMTDASDSQLENRTDCQAGLFALRDVALNSCQSNSKTWSK